MEGDTSGIACSDDLPEIEEMQPCMKSCLAGRDLDPFPSPSLLFIDGALQSCEENWGWHVWLSMPGLLKKAYSRSFHLYTLHTHFQDPSQLFVLKKVKVDEDNDKERNQAEMEVTVLSKLDHPLVLGSGGRETMQGLSIGRQYVGCSICRQQCKDLPACILTTSCTKDTFASSRSIAKQGTFTGAFKRPDSACIMLDDKPATFCPAAHARPHVDKALNDKRNRHRAAGTRTRVKCGHAVGHRLWMQQKAPCKALLVQKNECASAVAAILENCTAGGAGARLAGAGMNLHAQPSGFPDIRSYKQEAMTLSPSGMTMTQGLPPGGGIGSPEEDQA
eukprot:1160922-Pelagomonas_calceolata.AAC.7